MKKLKRQDEPPKLVKNSNVLEECYRKNTSLRVWRKPYIIKALLEDSNWMCAYCGKRITTEKFPNDSYEGLDESKQIRNPSNEEDSYLHVDHYIPRVIFNKEGNYFLVVKWTNLIPSCPRCNCLKSGRNGNEILDPYEDECNECFEISGTQLTFNINLKYNESLKNKSFKSYEVFHFQSRLFNKVSSSCAATEVVLMELWKAHKEALPLLSEKSEKMTQLCEHLKLEMEKGMSKREYGSYIAETIMQSNFYQDLKKELICIGFFNNSLEDLEKELILNRYHG